MEGIAASPYKISWPVVSRVMAALGFGTVTYVGAESAIKGAYDLAKDALTGLGAEVLQIIAIAGVFDFLAITSGGLISGLAWLVMKQFALQTTGPSQ